MLKRFIIYLFFKSVIWSLNENGKHQDRIQKNKLKVQYIPNIQYAFNFMVYSKFSLSCWLLNIKWQRLIVGKWTLRSKHKVQHSPRSLNASPPMRRQLKGEGWFQSSLMLRLHPFRLTAAEWRRSSSSSSSLTFRETHREPDWSQRCPVRPRTVSRSSCSGAAPSGSLRPGPMNWLRCPGTSTPDTG